LQKYSDVKVKDNAKINSESPAWAFEVIDISIENLSYE
jgi:hypothetical protein